MNRNLIFYIMTVAIFGSLLWFVFNQGAKLKATQPAQTSAAVADQSQSTGLQSSEVPEGAVAVFFGSLSENLEHPLSLLLIQIVVIVLLSKLLASLVRKIGQPQVIGEVIAGILLGPSVLGLFFPGVSQFIFQRVLCPT